MGRQIRLFIAVPVSRRLLEAGSDGSPDDGAMSLNAVLTQLRSLSWPVKAVASETMHVTLKFVGEVNHDIVPAITDVVRDVAANEAPFELRFEDLGAFPNMSRPSVVWAGLKNTDACTRMAAELDERLVELGVPAESRPFRPHLTLARIKGRPPSEVFELLETEQTTRFGSEMVSAIELVRSELKPAGPTYTTLAAAPLTAATT